MKSNLDLVNECDVFPYPSTPAHSALLSTLYTLLSPSGVPIGYLTTPVFTALAKTPIKTKGELEVNRSQLTVLAFHQASEPERSSAVAATVALWRAQSKFAVLKGWRDELYPVYGPGNELLFSVERSASCLFGVVTYGVHLMAYTREGGKGLGIKLWVPRRARNKQTYPGMLDNTVAGGMATGETPLECVIRECEEEASLPEELVRRDVKAHGTVTYCYLRDGRAGGETGLVQPECQYIFDLELPPDVVCKPNDSEVEEFFLWDVEEIQERLARGEFKPNCAMVMLDFFVRWGVLTKENEKDYEEIVRRLHRELEFPGPHRKE
ncbi:thiamine pyrophosphokinase-related protein-like protein [Leptodontidium sp. 2 PMI_412]|nr:thiamine pyrophosphokinase-related protein-like protein [Leptodontidium sp. MPI-SDFR-AT-0119]KAH9219694.1 thiamine pyrophosphokinase-related protein-like protein [Leptodontidium sp. 2 PMI_412]